jgi:hypothetical protein
MSMPGLSVLSVGEVHPMWYPSAGSVGDLSPACNHVMVSLPRLTERERASFHEQGRGGFFTYRGIVVLVLEWDFLQMTIPYHDNIIGETDKFERTAPNEHRLLTMALVHAETGEVSGLRASTLSRHVTFELQKQLDRHALEAITSEQFVEIGTSLNNANLSPSEVRRRAISGRLGT